MLRRSLALRILGPLALATLSGHAAAGGAWLPGGAQTAVEHRVAVALGPDRTTLWTSVRFEGGAGPVGVVVPVPPLATVDLSSDAWLEALEVATAPRVFPPEGVSPYCPGEEGETDPVHVAGDVGHTPTLAPAEILVLDDAAAVALWAAQHGLDLSPEIAAGLSAMQGKRFLTARFTSPGGTALTRTLRVVLPAAEPSLPLALTRAGNDDVRVTAWLMGPGRAGLSPSTLVTVPEENLVWNAGTLDSNYEDERMEALADAGPEGAVLECASHEALAESVPLGGSASIDSVITTYFERAVAYGQGAGDPASCAVIAAAALSSGAAVARSCPRADQGVVDGSDTCVEAPLPGETDPDRLRCGEGADDLAVGLSGLVPAGAWLTRYTLRVPAESGGLNHTIGFSSGAAVTPELDASGVSQSECEGGTTTSSGSGAGPGTGSGSGSGSGGPGSGTGTTTGGNNGGTGGIDYYDEGYSGGYVGCDCTGTADTSDPYYDDGSDDCSGDSSDSYSGDSSSDDCSGDSSDSYSDDTSSDDCSGDSSDSYDDSGSDDCSGDSSDSYADDSGGDCSGDSSTGGDSYGGDDCASDTSSGSSSDSCSSSSGSSDTSCDAGSGTSDADCSIAPRDAGHDGKGPRKKRGARLSPIALGALAVLAPLRRLMRPRRRRGGQAADDRDLAS